jgi:cellulose biosynthesis protein BcsQ
MKSVAFFNTAGGVGKTSLVFHLAWMYADLGRRVLLTDLDPQPNLTAMCFKEDVLDGIYEARYPNTIFTAVEPLNRGIDDLHFFDPAYVTDRLAIIPGDLLLLEFEDTLSAAWPECTDREERAFRVTAALHRILQDASRRHEADLVLIDVGPTSGALNRAALIAADYVVIPVAPDLFSIRGLENVGGRLKSWRAEWHKRLDCAPRLDFSLPPGDMQPIGYVVSRHTEFSGGIAYAFQKWVARFPDAYRRSVDDPPVPDDALSLGRLKDYRSLIAMAQDARKPMFKLRPGDGAIGGHQGAVSAAYDDFEKLARVIADRIGQPI